MLWIVTHADRDTVTLVPVSTKRICLGRAYRHTTGMPLT